jgi:uncharacterized protein (TIGR00369 family)
VALDRGPPRWFTHPMTEIPAGFVPHTRSSPVTDPWQPLLARRTDTAFEIGFEVRTAHCNARGLLHGGVLAALTDNAMGLSLGVALEAAGASHGRGSVSGIVTTTLSLDYLDMARPGDWVEIRPRVVKAGGGSGVVDALVVAGDGRLIARGNAVFKVLSTAPG